MPKIIIFTDFDGTLSGREGGKTVFEEFYQSLLNGYVPRVSQDYRKPPLKDSDTVQSLFEAQFGPYNKKFNYDQPEADLLLSREAVEFLHDMLSNDDVSVQIITRNRADYIRALLTYQGFNAEELNKLGIFDSVRKDMAVQGFLSQQTDIISSIYVLDDSRADYNYMVNAVASFGFTDEKIQKYHKMPGCFEWGIYQQAIHNLLQAPPRVENEKEVQEGELIELAISLTYEVTTEEIGQTLSTRVHNVENNEELATITPKDKRMPSPSFFKLENVPTSPEKNDSDISNTPS
ncbi:MAG: hypothetical protein P4L79_14685 [Legionella sp.]|uniref:hypothetical protein n=1 Tax=Legionella sp. TaxID=459 RepID=UPI00284AC458|nr:hypothetical protein [Legionella sp.]